MRVVPCSQGQRTTLLLLAWRWQIVVVAQRECGGNLDCRLLRCRKVAEAPLPTKVLHEDHGLEGICFALALVDVLVARAAYSPLQA